MMHVRLIFDAIHCVASAARDRCVGIDVHTGAAKRASEIDGGRSDHRLRRLRRRKVSHTRPGDGRRGGAQFALIPSPLRI